MARLFVAQSRRPPAGIEALRRLGLEAGRSRSLSASARRRRIDHRVHAINGNDTSAAFRELAGDSQREAPPAPTGSRTRSAMLAAAVPRRSAVAWVSSAPALTVPEPGDPFVAEAVVSSVARP